LPAVAESSLLMSKIIIVSNRLPINIQKKHGDYHFLPSSGGLVTAMKNVAKDVESLWIGWPGINSNSKEEKEILKQKLNAQGMHPVFISQSTFNKYYNGFSNSTVWPLFHYYPKLSEISDAFWDGYKRANQQFADQVLQFAEDGDVIWIHDYHLFLLPKLLREKLPNISIGYFQHIPFPSYEIFRILPWRNEILEGILGADLVGFHTFDDVRHFSSSASRILGTRHNIGQLEVGNRTVKVDTFPISIDYDEFAKAVQNKSVIKRSDEFLKQAGSSKLILSIDRLDISKGIPEKLHALDAFFDKFPQYKGKVTLVLVVVPSRIQVEVYKNLKAQIEQEVGRINGKFGQMDWMPIRYIYRALSATALSALYRCSSIALITPLRDGMNLVAKEYIASRVNGEGVLILSELAGAAKEMQDAIIVNPNNRQQVVEALHTAMEMPVELQIAGNRKMQERLKRYDVYRWSQSFLDNLRQLKNTGKVDNGNLMLPAVVKRLQKKYKQTKKRLFLLDYDGTLVNYFPVPQDAKPDDELKNILKTLTNDPQNHVFIISGRSRHDLQEWFEGINLSIIAEHGIWSSLPDNEWQVNPAVNATFKEAFRPLLEDYIDRTPGTFIEEKDYSLVWHYRQAESEFGQLRAREIIAHLNYMASNMPVQIMEGNKVVEVKHASVNKGTAVAHVVHQQRYDMILAIGDDITDEDIFAAVPARSYTIKVGNGNTNADYRLRTFKDVRKLLIDLKE
jgi:trehalose 6-phosphate synthase/phosphatase